MDHHYVPRSYLRQWSATGDEVVTYVRVGPPTNTRLRTYRKATRGICFEPDLYALEAEHRANGLTLQEIEALLGKDVDQEIRTIVDAVGALSGPLDSELGDRVKWLMQCFVARSPDSLRDIEESYARLAIEHTPLIQSLLATMTDPEMVEEWRGYLSPALPRVAARSGLVSIVAMRGKPLSNWYAGATVHIVRRADVQRNLNIIGLTHFPTFEDPVVQWLENGPGLIATFSLTPDSLVLVVNPEFPDCWESALMHIVVALRSRRMVIFPSKLKSNSPWLRQAEQLLLPTPPRRD